MKLLTPIAVLLLAGCNESAAPAIHVENVWARATLPGQMSSAAYFTIRNTGGPDKLVSVSSPSGIASMHSTSMDQGVMRMRAIAELEVPAKSVVELKPGGTHVMLMSLRAPLAAGSTFELHLKFEKSGDRLVSSQVRASDGAAM